MSQVLLRCLRINHQVVLLFKDSKAGPRSMEVPDSQMISLKAPTSEKQTNYAHRARGFTPQQKFGPAISEAAEPSRAMPSAIQLPHTSRWSEARPR
jgi:hypothetical protein